MTDWAFLSATDLAAQIKRGTITSVALTDYFIDRIERLDGDINAVVVRTFEAARAAAVRLPRVAMDTKDSSCLSLSMVSPLTAEWQSALLRVLRPLRGLLLYLRKTPRQPDPRGA